MAVTAALLTALARLGVEVDEGAEVAGLGLGPDGCEVTLTGGEESPPSASSSRRGPGAASPIGCRRRSGRRCAR